MCTTYQLNIFTFMTVLYDQGPLVVAVISFENLHF